MKFKIIIKNGEESHISEVYETDDDKFEHLKDTMIDSIKLKDPMGILLEDGDYIIFPSSYIESSIIRLVTIEED